MILLFQIIVWLCLCALIFYVMCSWVWEKRVKEKMNAIRKTWYLIFVIGVFIGWMIDPLSLFNEWKKYLIVAALFILIDAFIFLNSYIKRVGNSELVTETRELLEENDGLMKNHQNKLKTFAHLLKNDTINVYDGGKEAYIIGVEELISQFAEQINVFAQVCKYSTENEKEHLLEHLDEKVNARNKLQRHEIFYSDNEKLALIPLELYEESYVLKLSSTNYLTETDCVLFTSLVSIYDLMSIEGEGDDYEQYERET
ncbi:type II toxin-antitoxin system SpoIISA family toxin [Alkalihalobacterium alkalinitrilicum]|uniref:type II toxin-antitoxin system SpoIISA family toxin n=1 Tax=Alkalihalobacterium alkalinitrilicum TaxID=427920 RepID=UPI0009957D14|nr:type II toxin-antitoxin system SpoIISA family toxin [Alkalihalobacterium alkalinitrilicum]